MSTKRRGEAHVTGFFPLPYELHKCKHCKGLIKRIAAWSEVTHRQFETRPVRRCLQIENQVTGNLTLFITAFPQNAVGACMPFDRRAIYRKHQRVRVGSTQRGETVMMCSCQNNDGTRLLDTLTPTKSNIRIPNDRQSIADRKFERRNRRKGWKRRNRG
ncbi:hypothetical protein [Hydrogenophilus hirschii]